MKKFVNVTAVCVAVMLAVLPLMLAIEPGAARRAVQDEHAVRLEQATDQR